MGSQVLSLNAFFYWKNGRLHLCDTGGKTPVAHRYGCRARCKSKPAIKLHGLLVFMKRSAAQKWKSTEAL